VLRTVEAIINETLLRRATVEHVHNDVGPPSAHFG
jgi:hypothetical protein